MVDKYHARFLFKTIQPADEHISICMTADAVQLLDVCIYLNGFAKEFYFLSAIDDNLPQCANSLIPYEQNGAFSAPQVVFQVMTNTSCFTHTAGRENYFWCSDAEAMKNAGTALKSTEADAVKLEGGAEYAGLVRKMTGAGIPVMGHIGLMPQRVQVCGGYKIVGRDAESADKVLEDALALQDAGVFAIVLECIPEELGRKVTEALCIPTIGLGSGKYCSGQVQVITDLLGMMEFKPKHAKRYAEIGQLMTEALKNYADEVRSGTFPTPENTFQ